MTGHPTLAAAVDVLVAHARVDHSRYRCRCLAELDTDRAAQAHAEHVAQQLAIAGVLKGGAPT